MILPSGSLLNASTPLTPLSLESLSHELDGLKHDVDDMFIVFCAIITSFMQVGFASLEAGFLNSKNVTNIILKNILDTFICGIFYWLIGFSLAYTKGNMLFGYSGFGGWGLEPSRNSFWVFEFIFASTASTILSGSVAERCSFVTYMAYSSLISGFVYPIVSHWAWDPQGWLFQFGYMDLAGCGAVHALGGTCALVAAIFLGPRIGRFREDGSVVDMPGHSMSLVGIGFLILVSGFMGFNLGALAHVSGLGTKLGKVIQNTVLGGSGATILVLILCRTGVVGERTWAFGITVNAVLAGLVAVCGAVDRYYPIMALITGAAGCLNFLFVRHLVLRFRVDDPLDAVGVHFGGGIVGVLAGPLLAPGGIVYGVTQEAVTQLLHNVVGVFAIVAWSVFCSIILFGSLKLTGLLRVTEEQEIRGLDVSKHKEPAYPIKGWAIDYPVEIHQISNKNGSYTLNRTGDDFIQIGPHITKLPVNEHI